MAFLNCIDDSLSIETIQIEEGTTGFFSNKHEYFKVLHQNIRSVRKNFDELCVFLSCHNTQFNIIILTEAWVTEADNYQVELPGYDTFYSYAKFNKCDGIVVLCKTDLKASVSSTDSLDGANAMLISYNSMDNLNHTITAVYRPPSCNVENFVSSLNEYLETMDKPEIESHVMIGDFNIDICSSFDFTRDKSLSQIENEYLDTFASHGYLSVINSPTRLSTESYTCIDHIFLKHKEAVECKGVVLKTHITDHFTTVVLIPGSQDMPRSSPNHRNKTDFSQLESMVKDYNWGPVLANSDPNLSTDLFVNTLGTMINQSTKTVRSKKNLNKLKPWISTALIAEIKRRDKLKLQLKRNNDPNLRQEFTQMRTRLNNMIKKTKHDYFKGKLAEASGDLSKTWSTVREITNSSKKTVQIDSLCDESGQVIKNSNDIAECLNRYYASVANKLAAEIPQCSPADRNDFPEYMSPNSIFLSPANDAEILSYIKSLKTPIQLVLMVYHPTTLSASHVLLCLSLRILLIVV